MKKLVSLLLAMLMLLSCAQIALADDVPTLVITIAPENSLTTDFDDNLMTKYIEESLGINLEFQVLPADQPKEKLNIMVAGGDYLGDVIFCGQDVTSAMSYAVDQGAVIALDEYFDKYDTVVEAFGEENGIDMLSLVRATDGHIYGMPRYIGSVSNETKYRAYINVQWLENLGLSMPTTTDELYEVLKAFKEQDANGDGDPNDEIPMLGSAATWACDPYYFLMNPFTYAAEDAYQLNDGKVEYVFTQEEYRNGLRFMKKLVEEGLLAQDTYSNTNSTYYESLAGEEVNVGVVFCSAMNGFGADNPNLAQFRILKAVTGPEGVRGYTYTPTLPQIYWMVTADCKDPELAFKFLDFVSTNESFLFARYGVEDLHWKNSSDEEREMMGYAGTDLPLLFEAEDTWTTSNNIHWHTDMGTNFNQVQSYWNGDEAYFNYQRWLGVQDALANKPTEYVASLTFTPEEDSALAERRTALETYWKESRTNFIFGRMDLETEWESYLAELDKIGLAEILETAQTAYDRQYK